MSQLTIETPRGPVVIRPTQATDAANYRAMRLEALERHPVAFGSDYESSAARPMEYWHDLMRRGAGGASGITYVAEADHQLVGMTVLALEDYVKLRHSANIYSVYTQAAWRRTGVADALINACLDWARDQRVRVVKLGVAATNTAAIRLYLRCGFSVYGVEPEVIAWDGAYYDELLMARRIAPAR